MTVRWERLCRETSREDLAEGGQLWVRGLKFGSVGDEGRLALAMGGSGISSSASFARSKTLPRLEAPSRIVLGTVGVLLRRIAFGGRFARGGGGSIAPSSTAGAEVELDEPCHSQSLGVSDCGPSRA